MAGLQGHTSAYTYALSFLLFLLVKINFFGYCQLLNKIKVLSSVYEKEIVK